jgi:hypothetical protein
MNCLEVSNQTHNIGDASSTMTVWMTVTDATAVYDAIEWK